MWFDGRHDAFGSPLLAYAENAPATPTAVDLPDTGTDTPSAATVMRLFFSFKSPNGSNSEALEIRTLITLYVFGSREPKGRCPDRERPSDVPRRRSRWHGGRLQIRAHGLQSQTWRKALNVEVLGSSISRPMTSDARPDIDCGGLD